MLKCKKKVLCKCCFYNVICGVIVTCINPPGVVKLQSEKGTLEGAVGLNTTKQNLNALFHSCVLWHVTNQI